MKINIWELKKAEQKELQIKNKHPEKGVFSSLQK